jgi:hypothetical protein
MWKLDALSHHRSTVLTMEARRMGNVEVTPVDQEEGAAILDRAAQRLLHMSGDDFAARWENGDVEGMDHVAAMKVAMLIPLAR